MFSLVVIARMIGGVVTVILLHQAFGRSGSDQRTILAGQVALACLVCGLALGTAVDQYLSTINGPRSAMLLSCSLIIASLAVIGTNAPSDIVLMLAAFIAGLGLQGDWSSFAEMARRSVPSAKRWFRMRWFHCAFFVGVLIGCFAVTSDSVLFVTGLAMGCVALGVLTQPAESFRIPVTVSNPSEAPATGTPTESEVSPPNGEECDAVECCGGAAMEFQPTSFAHGVLIAAAGHCAFWISAISIPALNHGNLSNAVAVSVGLLAGHFLMLSAAPRTGYTVLVLPFLLLSIPAVIFAGCVDETSRLSVVAAFLAGLLPGGVMCGTSAITGELFSNCQTDPKRTRVLSMSLFATTLVILLYALVAYQTSVGVAIASSALIYTAGICVVREIPGAVISTLGKEDTDAETDSERREIAAALSK